MVWGWRSRFRCGGAGHSGGSGFHNQCVSKRHIWTPAHTRPPTRPHKHTNRLHTHTHAHTSTQTDCTHTFWHIPGLWWTQHVLNESKWLHSSEIGLPKQGGSVTGATTLYVFLITAVAKWSPSPPQPPKWHWAAGKGIHFWRGLFFLQNQSTQGLDSVQQHRRD